MGLELELLVPAGEGAAHDVLALSEALDRLALEEPAAAQVVKLRYFGGLTTLQASSVMGVSLRTANRHWVYARAWLYHELKPHGDEPG